VKPALLLFYALYIGAPSCGYFSLINPVKTKQTKVSKQKILFRRKLDLIPFSWYFSSQSIVKEIKTFANLKEKA